MSGLLPATRPLSANYGPDLENDAPVEDPDREIDATNLNKMKADLAYVARTAPLLHVLVENSGAASVASVIGPEGVVVGNVTVNRSAAGKVDVDWTATGVSGTYFHVTALDPTEALCTANIAGRTSDACRVITGKAGVLADCDFFLEIS